MIVLDTCAIIWDALEPKKLSRVAKTAIKSANQNDGIWFCEISLWEIAMLMSKKRLVPGTSYAQFIQLVLNSNQYHLVGLNTEIAELSANLPSQINADPADRIIAATAIIKKSPLVTADKNLKFADAVTTIW
jgi:PIN domain nuclease of toxin-antitoxin system